MKSSETASVGGPRMIFVAALAGMALSAFATQVSAGGCMHGAKYYGSGHGKPYAAHPMGYGHRYMPHHPMMRYGHGSMAYGYQPQTKSDADESVGKDIVETAILTGDFSTLVEAVQTAGLVDTLKAPGPFTVFAPTDEAFSNLPEGKLDELLKDQDKLAQILKYHVVSGTVTAADIVEGKELKTVQGQTIELGQLDVAHADIETSNGVIHVVNKVLIPTL